MGKLGTTRGDMTHGPLLGKMLLFALPLMASNTLQLLFNAADVIVVGQFAGSSSLAAVGSTSSLVNLLTNLFIGLSVGASVMVARHIGAGESHKVGGIVHTSIGLALASGVVLTILGVALSRLLLEWMGSPEDVIGLSTLYLRIYFLGTIPLMLYNFGAALLRAMGDTRRPMIFLAISGVLNLTLNLFFVIVCHMDVAGVALATIISQTLSAVLVLRCLMQETGPLHLDLRALRIDPADLRPILQVGLPAGLQSCMFNLSNVLIQGAINSFGGLVMAGNSASASIEGFLYTWVNSIHHAGLTFAGQNLGARNLKRVDRVIWLSLGLATVIGVTTGLAAVAFGRPLLGLYASDPAVIEVGMDRLWLMGVTNFLLGIMDVLCGLLRGIGFAAVPMLISMAGACGFRILWLVTAFPLWNTPLCVYLSYPISWILTAGAYAIYLVIVRRRLARYVLPPETEEVPAEA